MTGLVAMLWTYSFFPSPFPRLESLDNDIELDVLGEEGLENGVRGMKERISLSPTL